MYVSSQDFKLLKSAILSNGTRVTVKQCTKKVQCMCHLKISSYLNPPYFLMVPVSVSNKMYEKNPMYISSKDFKLPKSAILSYGTSVTLK